MEKPIGLLLKDLKAVERGQPAALSLSRLLQITNLTSAEPDHLSLIGRLYGGERPSLIQFIPEMISAMRVNVLVNRMSRRVSLNESNPQEDILTQRLVAVGMAQILREKAICPDGAALLGSISRNRRVIVLDAATDLLCQDIPYVTFDRVSDVLHELKYNPIFDNETFDRSSNRFI